jgi:hypothetical protein
MLGENNFPSCCGGKFFAGDTKIIKVEVDGLEVLTDYDVDFRIVSDYGSSFTLQKDRSSGITTTDNVISIRFEPEDTMGYSGTYNYRVRLTSPTGEINTVSWGTLTLS